MHRSFICGLPHRWHCLDFTMIPLFLPPWQVFTLEPATTGTWNNYHSMWGAAEVGTAFHSIVTVKMQKITALPFVSTIVIIGVWMSIVSQRSKRRPFILAAGPLRWTTTPTSPGSTELSRHDPKPKELTRSSTHPQPKWTFRLICCRQKKSTTKSNENGCQPILVRGLQLHYKLFLRHMCLGHCSSVGTVIVYGTGIQRINTSFSLVLFIFNYISFKWGKEPKGEQQEQQLK